MLIQDFALTNYPLSRDYRQHFEETVGSHPTYLSLTELRRQSPLRMLRTLRGLGCGRLFLPMEDANSYALLPVLQVVAACSDAQKIEIVHPNLERKVSQRREAAQAMAVILLASARARLSLWRCQRELEELNRLPRLDLPPSGHKKILYLNANLWFGLKAGGSVGHTSGVVNAFLDKGLDVTFAALSGLPHISSQAQIVPLAPPSSFALPSEINHYVFQEMVLKQMAPLCAPGSLAFIYQRLSSANHAGVVLSRRYGVPLIVEYNGSEVWVARNWGRALRYSAAAMLAEDVCLRHAHLIVTISEVLRDELLQRGVAAERIVCYPNCMDPKIFDPERYSEAERSALRQRLNLGQDHVVATFVGTFGQWHGVEKLAQAIKLMVDENADWLRQHKLRFLLIGDGLKMPLVREILTGPAYEPFVTLTGLIPQAQTPGYLAASDILLSPHVANIDGSRFFGSPTKLFEYMAMGKAIVASDLDQIGQVLQESLKVANLPTQAPQGGEKYLSVLTPPGDVPALAKAIRFLVDQPRWRGVLGGNARAEALRKYTWANHVDAILNGFQAVFPRR